MNRTGSLFSQVLSVFQRSNFARWEKDPTLRREVTRIESQLSNVET
jgi:hypothetical protein